MTETWEWEEDFRGIGTQAAEGTPASAISISAEVTLKLILQELGKLQIGFRNR